MADSVYQFVFYPYVDVNGYSVIRIVQPNVMTKAYDWQSWLTSTINMCVAQQFSGVIVSPYDAPMYEDHRKVYEDQCAS